jgi:hypothetical protein
MLGRDRDSLRAQQAIEDFPQSHHAEFADTAVAVVDADGFEGRCQDAELLDDLGAREGFVVAAVLVVFEEFDCEDGGAGDGIEGELFGLVSFTVQTRSLGVLPTRSVMVASGLPLKYSLLAFHLSVRSSILLAAAMSFAGSTLDRLTSARSRRKSVYLRSE